MTPEGKVKHAVNKVLKPYVAAGTVYDYMPVPSGYGKSSLDYLICVAGRFVAIETKKPGGEPTPRQQEALDKIHRAGGIVMVIDNVDRAPEVKRMLDSILNVASQGQP